MGIKFRITHYVPGCAKVDDEYKYVEVENDYEVSNYDDLQNLLLTLIDFATGSVKFKVDKEVIE